MKEEREELQPIFLIDIVCAVGVFAIVAAIVFMTVCVGIRVLRFGF